MKSDRSQNVPKKARGVMLTLNEIQRWDELRDYLLSLKSLTYGIAAKEVAPETGHLHIHCYCQFSKPIRLSLKKIAGAHLNSHSDPDKAKDYVEKDGEVIWEYGELRRRCVHVVDVKEKKDLDFLPINLYAMGKKILEDKAKYIGVDDWGKEIKVTYISGPSGSGKTELVKKTMKEEGYEKFNLVKFVDGFWHGVTEDCDVAVYDDWRDAHMKPSEFINFIDYNKQIMNIKGGSIKNNYKRIFITTVQPLEEIYRNVEGEPREQWMRRIKEVIKIDNP